MLALGSRADRTPEIGPGNLKGDLNLEHLGTHCSRANDLRFYRILASAVHQQQLLSAVHRGAENEQSAFLCGIEGLRLFIERVFVWAMAVNIYGRTGSRGIRSILAPTDN